MFADNLTLNYAAASVFGDKSMQRLVKKLPIKSTTPWVNCLINSMQSLLTTYLQTKVI